jgi:hypothetical protein
MSSQIGYTAFPMKAPTSNLRCLASLASTRRNRQANRHLFRLDTARVVRLRAGNQKWGRLDNIRRSDHVRYDDMQSSNGNATGTAADRISVHDHAGTGDQHVDRHQEIPGSGARRNSCSAYVFTNVAAVFLISSRTPPSAAKGRRSRLTASPTGSKGSGTWTQST